MEFNAYINKVKKKKKKKPSINNLSTRLKKLQRKIVPKQIEEMM